MKQILQSYKTGELKVADVPAPLEEPGCLLVITTRSLVSAGTEKMVSSLAKKSLIGKARARPDLLDKFVQKVARDGIWSAWGAAQAKLDQPIPLGYSLAGTVAAVGDGVSGFSVGDRVACAGAGVANHAEVNLIPKNLCVRVPDAVSDDEAAFVTVGAIALQGVRQAQPSLGETFGVIGLGLIGQITAQLLKASGVKVFGIDVDHEKVELATKLGIDQAAVRTTDVERRSSSLTGGRGLDGVIITAATASSDPVVLAGRICRDRGRVVSVGATGMDLPRGPYYEKELTFLMSRSYGPGRYDPVYEEKGIDYPSGYVRWTENRNMEAFVQAVESGSVNVQKLVSHGYDISEAQSAYDLLSGPTAGRAQLFVMGILLRYPAENSASVVKTPHAKPMRTAPSGAGELRIGFAGAGAFASGTLVPLLQKTPGTDLQTIVSNRGFSGLHLADKFGFERSTTDYASLHESDIDAVVVATRHNLHAEQVMASLAAGKHVFVEKPLALSREELSNVAVAAARSDRLLMVGYNRRFSPMLRRLQACFSARSDPLMMHYRVNAGPIPSDSWIHDPAVGGGRIVGEVCHFVDALTFVCGSLPSTVTCHSIAPIGGARADDNLVATITFVDGSVGTISYSAIGNPSAGKERFEVSGSGRSAILDDYRSLDIFEEGSPEYKRSLRQDKGHVGELAAFVRAARRGDSPPIGLVELLSTSLTTFAILESMKSGVETSVDGHGLVASLIDN